MLEYSAETKCFRAYKHLIESDDPLKHYIRPAMIYVYGEVMSSRDKINLLIFVRDKDNEKALWTRARQQQKVMNKNFIAFVNGWRCSIGFIKAQSIWKEWEIIGLWKESYSDHHKDTQQDEAKEKVD